jgi:hypothetical protein
MSLLPTTCLIALQYKQACVALVLTSDITEEKQDSLIQQATELLGFIQPITHPSLSIHRYLVRDLPSNSCSASAWPDKSAQWSGSEAAAKEADTTGCILESLRETETSEMFVRQQSGQWVITKRLATQQLTLVLGKKFGKEGSLVEADAALRDALNKLSDQS